MSKHVVRQQSTAVIDTDSPILEHSGAYSQGIGLTARVNSLYRELCDQILIFATPRCKTCIT
jgi:hypothetical protein